MKAVQIFVIGFLFAIAGMSAQNATPEQQASALTQKMQQQVKFSDAVKPKVESVNLDFIGNMQRLRDSGGSKLEKFKAFKKYDEQRTEAFRKILSDEEFKRFEKFREQNQEEMKKRYKERQQD